MTNSNPNNMEETMTNSAFTTTGAAPFFDGNITNSGGFFNNPERFVEHVLATPELPATLVVGSPDLPCEVELPLHELAATFIDHRIPRCRFVKTVSGVWFLVSDPHARADLPVRTEDGSLAEPVTAFTITYPGELNAVYQRHIRERNAAAPTAPCDEHHFVEVRLTRTMDDAGVENVCLTW